jgi:hypothetical protein
MKQYHIFHTIIQSRFPERKIQARKYVGFVNADSLEEAFVESQNTEEHWNPTNPCRSTSIGDIIQDDNEFYLVCSMGFELLEEPQDEREPELEYPQ